MALYKNPQHVAVTMQFGTEPAIRIEPGCVAEVDERWEGLVVSRGYMVVKHVAEDEDEIDLLDDGDESHDEDEEADETTEEGESKDEDEKPAAKSKTRKPRAPRPPKQPKADS